MSKFVPNSTMSSNNSNYIQHLPWDSDFFGFKVGKITSEISSQEQLTEIITSLQNHNYHLLYYSSAYKLIESSELENTVEIKMVDLKTTYAKIVNPNLEKNATIVSVVEDTENMGSLLKLAIQSGELSRFNVDKRIGENKFKEMYCLWLKNSLNRQIAQDVLVYKEKNEIAGFVTLGERNNIADIGIIAVDFAHRGKGIGKKLMQGAEHICAQAGYNNIQVVTQGANLAACKLYETCAYEKVNEEYFYHIWLK